MIALRTSRRLILYEWAGFGLVILVLWLDEILDLPHLVLGSLATPINIAELLIETLLVVPLAFGVTWLTAGLLRRVKHLEGLMHVCSICHRVRDGDDWLALEVYLSRHSQAELETTLCRECLLEQVTGQASDRPKG